MSEISDVHYQLKAVCDEIERKIVGQERVIRHTVAAILASGHVLLEDVPGTGKTTLASSLSSVLGLKFRRIQGTPDLLPSELVGTMVFIPSSTEFNFRQGPIFTNVLLMDEINRATPRTQSALLEAMAESQVSIDGETRVLPSPFFVIATANPIESQGVFPLPEAQLDRFVVRLKLGYTSAEDELEMVKRSQVQDPIELRTILSLPDLIQIQKRMPTIGMHDDVLHYIIQLCRATRNHEQVLLGASPRSILALTSFSQALSLLAGRSFVTPDDVQEAWFPVMNHRIHPKMEWEVQDGVEAILKDVLESTMTPTEFSQEA